MKVSFIGGGNMGEAILAALISKKLAAPGDIAVADAAAERRAYLAEKYGVYTTESNPDAAALGDTLILAVKPQHLSEVASGLAGRLRPGQLVVSIIAGKSIERLRKGLKHDAIVRAMPNTPAQIGLGMTVWTATEGVTGAQRADAEAIMRVMGHAVYTGDEAILDMATAVSGSGPAYVFLFMESLIQAGVDIGLPAELSRTLVFNTVLGSAEYARRSELGLEPLRQLVTSPGGTTAAALRVFEDGFFTQVIKQAVAAAYKRAHELGGIG